MLQQLKARIFENFLAELVEEAQDILENKDFQDDLIDVFEKYAAGSDNMVVENGVLGLCKLARNVINTPDDDVDQQNPV